MQLINFIRGRGAGVIRDIREDKKGSHGWREKYVWVGWERERFII